MSLKSALPRILDDYYANRRAKILTILECDRIAWEEIQKAIDQEKDAQLYCREG